MGWFDIFKPIEVPRYPKYWLRPKEDITAFEVAQLLRGLANGLTDNNGTPVQTGFFESHPELKRHFVKKED